MVSMNRFYISAAVCVVVALALGIIIGFFSAPSPTCAGNAKESSGVSAKLINAIRASNIEDNLKSEVRTPINFPDMTMPIKHIDKLVNVNAMFSAFVTHVRHFTKTPHIGGSPAEKSNAEYIRNEWIKQGLHSAKLLPYDVLLSYPNMDIPNKEFKQGLISHDGKGGVGKLWSKTVRYQHIVFYVLKISILENGDEIFHTALEEEILREEDRHPDIVPPFNAYSYRGEPEGDLVYANYARVQDFEYLEENYPEIDLNGTIIIARYGKIFRGNKALHAQAAGARGLILYSDPADYAIDGDIALYPDGWWLPETGCQRGNVFVSDAKGDPSTPGFPAKPYAYRLDDEDTALPKIPVHPIGYSDAWRLLSEMKGPVVSEDDWKGALNVSYRLGPGFKVSERKTKMTINTNRETRTTYDVIGYIRGDIEPDRYIVVGNHRDAWVYGAIDPSSGTAALMELTRVFGEQVKSGWKPRRSILFTSWGAEEYGLLGSTEYVEEFQKILGERAVAYLNVDGAVSGNYTFRVKSSPLLYNAIYEAAKKVPDPEGLDSSSTLYDSWKERSNTQKNERPGISNLGAGSDFAPFMYRIGVPAVDMRYSYDRSLGISSYPVYHSVYETFYYMKSFLDFNFYRHQAIARVWAELARDLADSVILPMNCTDYANKMRGSIDSVKKAYEERMNLEDITFDFINSALVNFTEAANDLHARIDKTDVTNPLEVRRINDQLMQVERAFIEPLGLPDRKFLRHIVFAPSSKDYYSADAFPGIIDAMYNIDEDSDTKTRWRIVKEQMALTAFIIQSAASTMTDVLQF